MGKLSSGGTLPNQSGGIPNPSFVLGKDNDAWVKTFTVGQRAAVKTGTDEASADQAGVRSGSKDTSQPKQG